MSFTAAQLLEVRAWVGPASVITDTEINAYTAVIGDDPLRVARQILRERIAELTSGPLDFTVEGDYTEKRGTQIDALRKLVGDLDQRIAAADAAAAEGTADSPNDSVGYLIRDNRDRLFGRR
jgi:hypothetical protein